MCGKSAADIEASNHRPERAVLDVTVDKVIYMLQLQNARILTQRNEARPCCHRCVVTEVLSTVVAGEVSPGCPGNKPSSDEDNAK